MKRPGCVFALALLGIAIAAFLLWMQYGGSWSIDRCLDSGGSWDYATQKCRR